MTNVVLPPYIKSHCRCAERLAEDFVQKNVFADCLRMLADFLRILLWFLKKVTFYTADMRFENYCKNIEKLLTSGFIWCTIIARLIIQ